MSNDIFADVFHGERGFIHALLQIFGENAILLRGDGARLRVLLARSNDVERKLDATGDALFDLYREGFRAAISPVGLETPPTPGRDFLLMRDGKFRIERVETWRAGGKIAGYTVEGALEDAEEGVSVDALGTPFDAAPDEKTPGETETRR